jgi:hypothetical protein
MDIFCRLRRDNHQVCRAQLGRRINERYAEALATVEDKTPLRELAQDLGPPTTWKGRSARALNPLAPADVQLLEAISRGEFMLNGFRNRDLRALLFAGAESAEPAEAKRQGHAIASPTTRPRHHHEGPQNTPLPCVGGGP